MTDEADAPAWLAALTPDGDVRLVDVAEILAEGRDRLLAVLRAQAGGHVDRVRVQTMCGTLQVYFHEVGPQAWEQPANRHARRVLDELGMHVGVYRGTFLFLAERDDREYGLSERQILVLLQAVSPRSAPKARAWL